MIQSGGIYSLVPIKPNTSEISGDVILITDWVKYRNYQCSMSRTLLISASEEQVRVYKILLGCFQHCVSLVSVGKKVKEIYTEGVEYIKSHDPLLVDCLSNTFGNGVGCKEDEKELEINGENETILEEGAIIELRIGLEGMTDQSFQYSMLLADTILITSKEKSREILTGVVSKAVKDTCYGIHDYIKTKVEKVDKSTNKKVDYYDSDEKWLRTSTRSIKLTESEIKRQEHQKVLKKQKLEHLRNTSLQTPIACTNLYFDNIKQHLIIQTHTKLLELHIDTINNTEYIYKDLIKIKEGVIINVPNIESAYVLGKIISKHNEVNDKEVTVLDNVFIKVADKKVNGQLKAFSNKLQFIKAKEIIIDVSYKSVKYIFYQNGKNLLTPFLHLHFRYPIAVCSKLTFDIQFFFKMKAHDQILLEKLNKFIADIELLAKLKCEISQQDKEFIGIINKTNNLLTPTSNCLVGLAKYPFFIVALTNIELMYFEILSKRSFNIIIVLKDYVSCIRIDCVSSNNMKTIKEWIDSIDIVYLETEESFVWEKFIKVLGNEPERIFFDEADKGSEFAPNNNGESEYMENSMDFSLSKKRAKSYKVKPRKVIKFDLYD